MTESDWPQNLARERAKNFGSEPADPAHPAQAHRGHLIPTASSSIVVTTTADDALADNALMSPKEEREFAMKPRGFFADQFEVWLAATTTVNSWNLTLSYSEPE